MLEKALMLHEVYGQPGDDDFSPRLEITPYCPWTRGSRGNVLERLKKSVTRKLTGSSCGYTHLCFFTSGNSNNSLKFDRS